MFFLLISVKVFVFSFILFLVFFFILKQDTKSLIDKGVGQEVNIGDLYISLIIFSPLASILNYNNIRFSKDNYHKIVRIYTYIINILTLFCNFNY